MNSRPIISHIITMGDSLTDRGTLYKDIILRILSGIAGKSPDGSFTNGYPWDDDFIAELASEFTIRKLMRGMHLSEADIVDAILAHDRKVEPLVQDYYDLKKSDKYISYDGKNFLRSYAEGGLTSHDYSWQPSTSVSRFFTRLIVATLTKERKKLLSDDVKYHVSSEHKEQTLVIEWSGANDLITVNARPSQIEVDKAIQDRIENIKQLILHGYRHFILINLPDISLTPRYQAKSQSEQANARECSLYFNQQLEIACKNLSEANPNCLIDVFDADKEFVKIYNDPEKYGFDKSKLRQPYVTSKDFKMLKNGTSPATGYAFWDDVHPSADLDARFAYVFCKQYKEQFQFIAPTSRAEKNITQTSTKSAFFYRPTSNDKNNTSKFTVELIGKSKVCI